MNIKNKDERNCLLLSIFVFFFHLLFIKFYPVNFEFSFSEGAKYLYDFDRKVINNYFFNQANTFVFSVIIGLVDRILLIDNTLISARLLSATSYLFFGLGFIKIFKFYKIKLSGAFFIFYFLLNPLIWTYGHRGIPDLFATSLAFYTFSNFLLLKNTQSIKNYLNFFFLGISISIKPFCIIYLALIFLIELNRSIFLVIKNYFLLFFTSSLIPIFYFSLIKINFGFYLIPNEFAHELTVLKGGFFKNFFGYTILLSLFILPLSLRLNFFNFKNLLVVLFVLLPLSFHLYFLTNHAQAELNLGFFNSLVGDVPVFFISVISFYILFIYFYNDIKLKNKLKNFSNYKFLLIVLFYIIVLSFTRPSQRYLVTIMPIFMIFFLINGNYFKEKIFFKLVAFGYILMNILIFINFYLNSSINKEVVGYLAEKNILKETLPGPLYPHSYHFFYSKNKKKYTITRNPKNTIKTFHKKFLILEKKFFLKRN